MLASNARGELGIFAPWGRGTHLVQNSCDYLGTDMG